MSTQLIQELKGYKAVKDLVEGELSDYSYWSVGKLKWNDGFGDYEEDDEQEHYEICVSNNRDKTKILSFNYNKKEETIEIELGEDNWHEVNDYDYRIKYFWMALLEW